MTVMELIKMLEKVKCQTAVVYLHDAESSVNELNEAVIEHDLKDDEVVVILR